MEGCVHHSYAATPLTISNKNFPWKKPSIKEPIRIKKMHRTFSDSTRILFRVTGNLFGTIEHPYSETNIVEPTRNQNVISQRTLIEPLRCNMKRVFMEHFLKNPERVTFRGQAETPLKTIHLLKECVKPSMFYY